MSFQKLVTERLAAITELVNSISNSAKKIEELPKQDPLVMTSKIHVSREGKSEHLDISTIVNKVVEEVNSDEYLKNNIFPELKLSWGHQKKEFKKKFKGSTTSYDGEINLLECNIISGLDNLLEYNPKIILYRYKSKRKVRNLDLNGEPFQFVKKAKFYFQKPTEERKTVIPITSRKMALDFGLDNYFERNETLEQVWAKGMVSLNTDLYHKKGKTQAHFYIHLRLKLTVNEKDYTSEPSDVLRVYYDIKNKLISYERT